MTPASAVAAMLWRYFAAVEADDQRALRHGLAPDATWTIAGTPPISGTWRAPRAIVDVFLAAAMSMYEPGSIRLQITGADGDGDGVVLRWSSVGRRAAGFVEEPFCRGVVVVRDGRIQSVGVTPVAAMRNGSARAPADRRDSEP